MIRTSRRPSPSSISRTRSRTVTRPVAAMSTRRESPAPANLICHGTSTSVRRPAGGLRSGALGRPGLMLGFQRPHHLTGCGPAPLAGTGERASAGMQPPPVTADHDERQFTAAAGPPLLQVEARDRRPCDQVPRGRRVPHDEVIRGDADAPPPAISRPPPRTPRRTRVSPRSGSAPGPRYQRTTSVSDIPMIMPAPRERG
jgi:hypothetical protein